MTTNEKIVSASRRIEAPASQIFDLLADPARHREIDGSGTVRNGHPDNPERLALGDSFGMDMKIGVPYRISNEVVEFEENHVIAWRHFGHHVWRYELEADGDATVVTESFNWGVARFPPFYQWMGYPAKSEANMKATLERLDAVMTASS